MGIERSVECFRKVSPKTFITMWRLICRQEKLMKTEIKNSGQIEPQVSQPFTHLDLFSGIGGFALAAKSTWGERYRNVGFCEIDGFCQKVLRKNFGSDIKIFNDIKNLTRKDINGTVRLITGGFPCQPFSVAGKKKGASDDRFLWPEMFRLFRTIRPEWLIGENVVGLWNMEFEDMLSQVESEGYQVETFIIPACALNAPHRRDRIWILAYPSSRRLDAFRNEKDFTYKNSHEWSSEYELQNIEGLGCAVPKYPEHLRVADGVSRELDKSRIKALGNAIVPQVAAVLLAAVKTIDDGLIGRSG